MSIDRRRSGLRVGLLVCAGLWLVASSLAAQSDATSDESTEYSQLVAEAVRVFDEGRFLEARALLMRAHAMYPNARTLRGMGLAAFEAGRYALVVSDLSRALAEQRQALTLEQRAEANQLLIEADAATARYRLLDRPGRSTLDVDGEPAVVDDEGRLVVDPGQHRLTVSPIDSESYSLVFDAAAGQRVTLTLRHEPPRPLAFAQAPAAPAPPPIEAASPAPPPQPTAASGLSVERTFAYAAFAGAAVAGGLTAWQWAERESAVSAWNRDACLDRGRTRRANCGAHESDYERAQTFAWVTGVTTIALSASAVALWLLEPERTETRPDTASCAVGVSALQCRVVF